MVLVLALAGCPPPRPPDVPPSGFWSLVKITTDDSSFAFKCIHEQGGSTIRIRCFTPVEVPLFDIDIQGNAVSVQAASGAVAERIPFDIRLVGADVWRVHVAMTDDDLADYDAQNDPDLPEDRIEVDRDGEGRPVMKTFRAGEKTTAVVSFHDLEGEHAGSILLTSVDPDYTIEILQGSPTGDPHQD